MSEDATTQSDHGELKHRIAQLVGTSPGRYGADLGTERHKRLLNEEITLICERAGMGFLSDESKQERMDSITLKLGRDHRTGIGTWDTSDLAAVVRHLEPEIDYGGEGTRMIVSSSRRRSR